MATPARCLCRHMVRSSHRTQWLSYYRQTHAEPHLPSQTSYIRSFSSTTRQRAEQEAPEDSADENAPYFNNKFFSELDRSDQSTYRNLSTSERKRMEDVAAELASELGDNRSRSSRELDEAVQQYANEVDEEFPDDMVPFERPADSFFNMGEREDLGPDDEFMDDDITSDAHRELEQHREIREYARLAGWEMPLLANLQVPFQPPTAATPLRFRYTTYMGEQHPASRKVVVEFTPSDLQLTAAQRAKIIKLAGARYNPHNEIIKMSCESFETQAQNKRYLGDTIENLIKEAKDSADTFEDVPFDFRHAKTKTKPVFPREWLLTAERKKMLEETRRARIESEAKRAENGGLVSGVQAIEEGRKINLARAEAPVMQQAMAKLPAGKMGKKQMGQKSR